MCSSRSPCLELLAPSLWTEVFPCSSRFSIVNEEDRRERGLLVLIYPGGSLGITINSQLLAHSTGPHRHCQFVPIREPSFWVSAVRGCEGRSVEKSSRMARFGPDHLLAVFTCLISRAIHKLICSKHFISPKFCYVI